MIRSASASIARPSSAVKNCQGPGLAATGGFPAFGSQGRVPTITRAWSPDDVAANNAALESKRDRRETPRRALSFISRFSVQPPGRHRTELPWLRQVPNSCRSEAGCRKSVKLSEAGRAAATGQRVQPVAAPNPTWEPSSVFGSRSLEMLRIKINRPDDTGQVPLACPWRALGVPLALGSVLSTLGG